MNLREIVTKHLVEAGLSGLYHPDHAVGCACRLDDLFPCGNPSPECRAGRIGPCDCGDHDFHVVEPEADAADAHAGQEAGDEVACPACQARQFLPPPDGLVFTAVKCKACEAVFEYDERGPLDQKLRLRQGGTR